MNIKLFFSVIIGVFLINNMPDAGELSGKKIFFIDSYNDGYFWSDGLSKGVRNVLSPTGASLQVFHLDSKRNPSDASIKSASEKAVSMITEFKPDIIIAADDNATKYIIVPNYKNGKIPVVFCGLNWDVSAYGFPCSNVTGMVEVAPVKQLVANLAKYAKGSRIGYLAADNETERKEVSMSNKKFGLDIKPEFVTTFADWKKQFSLMQSSVDILLVGVFEGIKGWDYDSAKAYVKAETVIPTGAIHEYIADLVLLALTKLPDEQGEYAANVATQILKGKTVQDFPVTENKKSDIIVNMKIAQKLNVSFDVALLKVAKILK